MKKLKDFLDGQIRHKFQRKVLLAILLSVVVICIITNVVISTLLGQELLEKKEDIEEEYLSVIYSYLDEMKDNLDVLAIIAESSSNVKWVDQKICPEYAEQPYGIFERQRGKRIRGEHGTGQSERYVSFNYAVAADDAGGRHFRKSAF